MLWQAEVTQRIKRKQIRARYNATALYLDQAALGLAVPLTQRQRLARGLAALVLHRPFHAAHPGTEALAPGGRLRRLRGLLGAHGRLDVLPLRLQRGTTLGIKTAFRVLALFSRPRAAPRGIFVALDGKIVGADVSTALKWHAKGRPNAFLCRIIANIG